MNCNFSIGFAILTSIFIKCLATESAKCSFGNGACYLQNPSVLRSNNIAISSYKNELITRLYIWRNSNVKFLPILVHQTFPNLKQIEAKDGSIQNISRANFDRLNRMEELVLSGNQIETVKRDTFWDLVRLKKLDLGKFYDCITR